MKTRFYTVCISILKKIGILLLFATIGYSCGPKDIALETFKGEMIYSFLKKDTAYSEYVKIVDRAGLKGMLSAYGAYTCLAPTNAAFKAYYDSLGTHFTLDSLRKGQIDTLARSHIIPNKYLTIDLTDGVIPNTNMNQRYIEIKFSADTIKNSLKITLNEASQIVSKDNEVYNGVVQGISQVLKPANIQLPDLIANNKNVSIFSDALILTRLSDSLRLIKDNTYKPTKVFKDEYNTYLIVNPAERKYGYTALVEDNDLLRSNGINTLADLIQKAKDLYPSPSEYDNDFTNRNNSLNKYISYHLINKVVFLNKFFYTSDAVKGYTPDEFMETMYTNRIIKTSKINDQITLNPNSDNAVHVQGTGSQTTINGVYHLLDNMLVYSNDVERMLQNTRIRFDIVSLFPEMTNNNIRGSRDFMKVNNSSGDRFGFEPGYLKDIKMSKDTRLIYLAGKQGQWANYQSDELMGLGAYDITMRLLPVPPGTYELRFGYSANGNRSVTQVYVDNKPVGIPIDLTIASSDPRVGYLLDKLTDDNGFENDKIMRNRGYMKAPTTYLFGTTIGRDASNIIRRVVGTFTFNDYEPHTLRFKSVTSDPNKQCMMDYFEYVPKSIYNPASGEPESRD